MGRSKGGGHTIDLETSGLLEHMVVVLSEDAWALNHMEVLVTTTIHGWTSSSEGVH